MKKTNISYYLAFALLATWLFGYLCAQNIQTASEGRWVAIAAGGYNGKVVMFEIPSLKLLKEAIVGTDIHAIAISPDGKFVYAADKASNIIAKINLETFKLEQPLIGLPLGFGPSELAIYNKSLFVTGELGGQVAKINLEKNEVEKIWEANECISAPDAIAVTRDGKHCLVTDYFNNLLKVYTTEPFKLKRKIIVGEAPYGLAVTENYALVGSKLSSTISFINLSGDIETWKVDEEIETAGGPFDIVSDSKGNFAYQSEFLANVISKVNIEKKEVVAQFKVSSRPYTLAITPDGKYIVSANAYSPRIPIKLRLPNSSATVSPMNLELLDLTNGGKSMRCEPVSGCPRDIKIVSADLSAKLLKRFGGEPCPFISSEKVDIHLTEGAALSYGAPVSRPPSIKGKRKVARINLKAFSFAFVPNELASSRHLRQGRDVQISLTNVDEQAGIIGNEDIIHGFIINGYGPQTNVLLPKGVTATLKFKADKRGEFIFYCSRICGPMCKEMRGKFRVR